MFERVRGGTFAEKGTYLSLREGEFVSIPEEGDYLPGTNNQTFLRIPLAMVLVLGPFLGLLFVVILPMAVPLVVGMLLIQRFKRRVPELRDSAIRVTTYGQQPGMAYLQMKGMSDRKRQRDRAAKNADDTSTPKLEELITKLEEDIAKRREAGEK